MEDNLKLCLCAFVRNRGKTVFTESLLLMGMSMDLRWMSYSDAKAVLKAMLSQGLLERSGDMIRHKNAELYVRKVRRNQVWELNLKRAKQD